MSDSPASVMTGKLQKTVNFFPPALLGLRRTAGRALLRGFYGLFTRTRVEGLEHIPEKGPLLVLPNHLSNLDGPLVLGMYPRNLEMLGPRDFKMEPFKTMLMTVYGMTLIRRGFADSEAVNSIIRHLRKGKHLLMFPSGGMWEKRSFSSKTGALYFSQLTQTPILPVGISGAYLQSHRTLTMHKPELVLRYGEVIDPVSKKGSKKEREQRLSDAKEELGSVMYGLLEPSEKQRYERWSREIYAMEVRFRTNGREEVVRSFSDGFIPTLAEFAIKPNLFRPMWLHAGKNMDAFLANEFHDPSLVQQNADDLEENLTGDFSQYLPYRLGEEAHASALAEIGELRELCSVARRRGAVIKLVPTALDPLSSAVRTSPLVG